MTRKTQTAARLAMAILLTGIVGAAARASAYSAQIELEAGGGVYLLDHTAADSKYFGPETFSTNLTVPLAVHRDTSVSAGPSSGHYVATLGAYDAWVEPGGMHLSARSYAAIDYAAVVGDDRYLHAQDGGTVEVSVLDDVTFSGAGLPQGTPFFMDFDLSVGGSFGAFGGAAGTPVTPNAYATADGFWSFAFLVPSRPASIPPSITNRFEDTALAGVLADGTVFNQFTQYGYPKTMRVTMYALSGVPSQLEMYARLTTGAFADATYLPTESGSVDASVNCNLSDTVSWGGIAAARTIDGTPMPLSDVSAVSSSGFDYETEYVSSVPEPSTSWAMSIAAGALWFARRRQAAASTSSRTSPRKIGFAR